MYATNYFEQMILNVFRGATAAAPSTVYLGLFLTSPGESGSAGQEVSYTGYARQPITFSAPAAMETGIGIQNAADITFPASPSSAGSGSYIGVFDSATDGNCLLYGALEVEQDIEVQEAPVIVAGGAKWWLSGDMTNAFKAAVLNLLRGVSVSGVTPYLALYTDSPDNEGVELSGDNYERLALTFGAPTEQGGGECKISTTASVATNRASTVWGTWGYTAVMSAASGGNPLFGKIKTPAKIMRVGLLVTVTAGDLSLAVN